VRTYLDHASTSPLRPEARAALVEALDLVGDPGRIHAEGLTARVAVEQARDRVAALFGARNREVVLTSGATEAIAAACWGTAERGAHQVVTAVEHSAVRLAADRHGAVTAVPVDGAGRVDPDAVMAAVRPDTALLHVQWGNHEVGTVQPVAAVVAACRARGVLVHVDAAQAAGHAPIAFDELGADLLSVSAHKLGGPAGVGALLVRRGVRLTPLLVGGDQERARRAGLENVAGVVGFGAACATLAGAAPAPTPPAPAPAPSGTDGDGGDRRSGAGGSSGDGSGSDGGSSGDGGSDDDGSGAGASGDRDVGGGPGPASRLEAEAEDQRRLTRRIVAGTAPLDGLVLYGPADEADRLPHVVCLGVEGIEPQAVLLGLDRTGIAAHSGSACSSESLEPSPVLEAMGVDAHHSLRLSVGWSSTGADVDHLLTALPAVLAELRSLATGR